MTVHYGNVDVGETLYIPFATYDAAGASITITGLIAADIEIYKDGNTTQRASDAGYTLLDTDGIDFDGVTGIHGFSVDLSDNTDAGFYVAGSQYWVVVSAITVDGETVNFVAATFKIGAQNVNVAQVSGDATAADNLELDYDGTGYAKTNSTIGTCTTNTDMRGTDNALLAASYTAPDNASIADILTDTGTTIPVQIAALNNISSSDVNAACDTALADYDAPTKAEMDTAFLEIKGAGFTATDTLEAIRNRGDAAWITATGFSTLDAAGVRTAVGLASANLDTQLTAIVTDTGTTIPAQISALNNISVSDILAGVIEGTTTFKQAMQLIVAAAAGKLSGAATSTVSIRDQADTKNRIVATVDSNGNRSAITTDFD